jgi:hypothetical protein
VGFALGKQQGRRSEIMPGGIFPHAIDETADYLIWNMAGRFFATWILR